MDERISQAGLMRRIYRAAKAVRVWLGEAADDSDNAMKVVSQIGRPQRQGPGLPATLYPDLSPQQRRAHWHALRALFRRSWWERAWVRQEIALARTSMVQCGSESCLFQDLAFTGDALDYVANIVEFNPLGDSSDSGRSRRSDGSRSGTTEPRCSKTLQSDSRHGSGWIPLVDLLRHARGAQATVPLDKVFSVLGLADPEIYKLTPDYRLTTRDLYVKTAVSIVSHTRRLDILSLGQNPERRNGLPSWVPNLLDGWKANPFPRDKAKTSTGITGLAEAVATFSESNEKLSAKGWHYDEVESFSEDIVHMNDSNEALLSLYLKWKENHEEQARGEDCR